MRADRLRAPDSGVSTRVSTVDRRNRIAREVAYARRARNRQPKRSGRTDLKSPWIFKKRLDAGSHGIGFEFRIDVILAASVCACACILACSEREAANSQPSIPAADLEASAPQPDTRTHPALPDVSNESAADSGTAELAPPVGPKAPPERILPLDDLLRLPESVVRSHIESAESAESGSEPDAQTEKQREAASLRIKILRQRESAEVDPDGTLTRERTDAGVSVDVGGDTRVGGGVHVVQDPDGEFRDPVPTVGVEKRF